MGQSPKQAPDANNQKHHALIADVLPLLENKKPVDRFNIRPMPSAVQAGFPISRFQGGEFREHQLNIRHKFPDRPEESPVVFRTVGIGNGAENAIDAGRGLLLKKGRAPDFPSRPANVTVDFVNPGELVFREDAIEFISAPQNTAYGIQELKP